jgi:hypothetical protein
VVENNIVEHFHVSEQLLMRYALNFYATLADKKKKKLLYFGRLQVLGVSHDTFKDFNKWLMHQIYWDSDADNTTSENTHFDEEYCGKGLLYNDEDNDIVTIRTARIYLFACKYGILQLRKVALDRFLQDPELEVELVETSEFVYTNTAKDSPLRRILVDRLCNERCAEEQNKEQLNLYQKESLVDVMVRNADFLVEVDAYDLLIHRSVHGYHEYNNVGVERKRKLCTSRVKENGGRW